jgi:glutamyl/glutaminyl-tRNA synthetase
MRRRGISPEAINTLCQEIGITRSEGSVQLKRLYHHVRLHLDATSPRALAVLRPLKLVRGGLSAAYCCHCMSVLALQGAEWQSQQLGMCGHSSSACAQLGASAWRMRMHKCCHCPESRT